MGLTEVETSARALGHGVLARRVDVADRDQVRDFAEAVHGEAGTVDLLVNNAGVGWRRASWIRDESGLSSARLDGAASG